MLFLKKENFIFASWGTDRLVQDAVFFQGTSPIMNTNYIMKEMHSKKLNPNASFCAWSKFVLKIVSTGLFFVKLSVYHLFKAR